MDVDGRGWLWMDADGTWMAMDGEDGRGWTWMDADGGAVIIKLSVRKKRILT